MTEYSEETYNLNEADVGFDRTKFSFAFSILTSRILDKNSDESDLFDVNAYLKCDSCNNKREKLSLHQCNESDFDLSFPETPNE